MAAFSLFYQVNVTNEITQLFDSFYALAFLPTGTQNRVAISKRARVKKFSLVLTLFLGLSLPSGAALAQQIQSMKLLTMQAGWARSGDHLYWTTDGGTHWKDVAPYGSSKKVIVDVLFLDTNIGWALLSGGD